MNISNVLNTCMETAYNFGTNINESLSNTENVTAKNFSALVMGATAIALIMNLLYHTYNLHSLTHTLHSIVVNSTNQAQPILSTIDMQTPTHANTQKIKYLMREYQALLKKVNECDRDPSNHFIFYFSRRSLDSAKKILSTSISKLEVRLAYLRNIKDCPHLRRR